MNILSGFTPRYYYLKMAVDRRNM